LGRDFTQLCKIAKMRRRRIKRPGPVHPALQSAGMIGGGGVEGRQAHTEAEMNDLPEDKTRKEFDKDAVRLLVNRPGFVGGSNS